MPQLLDPNWPIYASQRAVRYYWPCKKRHLAELTSRFDTSRKHDWTNEDVQFIMDFFVVERFKKKKGCKIFMTFLSIFLSFFFFTDGLRVPFESPFSRREVAALKFLPFQRAHLFASGIPIVIREPTVRQSGQHRYVSVNRDSCTHHKNLSRR